MNELRPLLPYLRPYRREYAVGMVLVVVSNFFTTLGPKFIEQGIDALRTGAGFHAVQTAVGLLLAVALAGGLARYGMRELLNSGSRRVETDLRDHLYRHLQRMSAEFYDRYPTGDVMARTTNDLLAVRMVAGPALMYLVDTTIRALLIAPAMLAINPRLTLVALVPLLGSAGGDDRRWASASTAGARPSRSSSASSPARRTRISPASGWSAPTARSARRSPPSARLSDDYLGRNLNLARVQGLFFPLLTLLGGLSASDGAVRRRAAGHGRDGDRRRVRRLRRVPRPCWCGR